MAGLRVGTLLLCAHALSVPPLFAATEDQVGIVYWGNVRTGVAVRVINGTDRRERARAEVERIGGGDWVLLEDSSRPGFGAAMCIRKGDQIRFHVVHGLATAREAITAAQQQARATGGLWSTCSRGLWSVAPLPDKPRETGVVDHLKGAIRSGVSSARGERDYPRDCVPPAEIARAELRPLAPGTIAPKDVRPPATPWKRADWCPRFQGPGGSAAGRRG